MAYNEDTRRLALEAAEYYYDNVLKKGRYPGDFNRLPKVREEAILQLAKEGVGKLREAIPQDYTDAVARKTAALDAGAASKYMYEFGEDPFTATRKSDLSAITGDEGKKSWYDMDPMEIEAQMYSFGYDPSVPGDKQKFLNEVAEYQTNRDRADIVKNDVEDASWYEKLGMAMNPTATDEAVRQSLTGDFDDRRMDNAVATDLLVQGGMAVAPSFRAVASQPLVMGAVDAGLEGLRQTSNYLADMKVDPMAPFGAGVAAGTVPAGAQYIGGILSRGGSMSARPLARGFQRGLRGADDPVKAERENLKRLLVDARKQGENTQAGLSPTGNPQGNLFGVSELEQANTWQSAADKLRAMGFRNRELEANAEQAFNEASKKVKDIKAEMRTVQTDRSIEKSVRDNQARALQSELDGALAEQERAAENYAKVSMRDTPMSDFSEAYGETAPAIEDVIGRNPTIMRGGPVQVTVKPKYDVETVLRESYDRPMKYLSLDAGSAATPDSYASNKIALDLLRGQLPEKYAVEAVSSNRPYNVGRALGQVFGGVGGSLEPALRANPLQPTSYKERVTEFKNSKWYRDLPKEKKNAVERALKGGN